MRQPARLLLIAVALLVCGLVPSTAQTTNLISTNNLTFNYSDFGLNPNAVFSVTITPMSWQAINNGVLLNYPQAISRRMQPGMTNGSVTFSNQICGVPYQVSFSGYALLSTNFLVPANTNANVVVGAQYIGKYGDPTTFFYAYQTVITTAVAPGTNTVVVTNGGSVTVNVPQSLFDAKVGTNQVLGLISPYTNQVTASAIAAAGGITNGGSFFGIVLPQPGLFGNNGTATKWIYTPGFGYNQIQGADGTLLVDLNNPIFITDGENLTNLNGGAIQAATITSNAIISLPGSKVTGTVAQAAHATNADTAAASGILPGTLPSTVTNTGPINATNLYGTLSRTNLPANVVTNGQAAVTLTNGAFTGTHRGTNYYIWNPFAGYVPLASSSAIYNPGSGGMLADASGVYAPNGMNIMDNNGNYGGGDGSALTNVTAVMAKAPMEFDIDIVDGCGGTIAFFDATDATFNRDVILANGSIINLQAASGIIDSVGNGGYEGQIFAISNSLPTWVNPTSTGSASLTNIVPFFNVKTFGAFGDGTHDDTAAIQSAVNAAQVTNGIVWFDTGTYKITQEILATNPCAFHGSFATPLFGKNSVFPNTSAVMVTQAPYLTGAVIVQTTAYSNILHLRPSSSAINVENLGLKFADTIKFTTTGHGILCDAPTNSGYGYDWGLQGASWQNVFVYGHDGNHYAFKLINYQLDSFINLQGYGGGGIESYCDSFYPSASQSAGNSVFYAPYFCTTLGGSAHGYYLHASAASGQGNYLITFVRPQSFFNMRGANQPTTSQYQFYADDTTAILDCYGGDWESGPGNGGGGVHLPSNMLSGITPAALGSTVDHTFFKSTWQSGGVTIVPSLISVDIINKATANPTFTQTTGNVLSLYGGSGQYAFFDLGTTPGVNLMALGACNASGQGFSTSSSGSAVITATAGDLLLGASPAYPNLIPEAIRVPNNTSNVIINGTLTLSKGVSGNGSGLTNLVSLVVTNSAGGYMTSGATKVVGATGLLQVSVITTNTQIVWLTNLTSHLSIPMGNLVGVWTNYDSCSMLCNSNDSVQVTNISGSGGAALVNSFLQVIK